jgi:hypothetical protein
MHTPNTMSKEHDYIIYMTRNLALAEYHFNTCFFPSNSNLLADFSTSNSPALVGARQQLLLLVRCCEYTLRAVTSASQRRPVAGQQLLW